MVLYIGTNTILPLPAFQPGVLLFTRVEEKPLTKQRLKCTVAMLSKRPLIHNRPFVDIVTGSANGSHCTTLHPLRLRNHIITLHAATLELFTDVRYASSKYGFKKSLKKSAKASKVNRLNRPPSPRSLLHPQPNKLGGACHTVQSIYIYNICEEKKNCPTVTEAAANFNTSQSVKRRSNSSCCFSFSVSYFFSWCFTSTETVRPIRDG